MIYTRSVRVSTPRKLQTSKFKIRYSIFKKYLGMVISLFLVVFGFTNVQAPLNNGFINGWCFSFLTGEGLISPAFANCYSTGQAQNQIITPEPSSISVGPGEEFSFSVKYDVSDKNNMLTGIGLRLHYDSSILEFVEMNNVFEKSKLQIGSPQDDTENQDGDDNTDKVIVAAWADISPPSDWPGEDLPLILFEIKFKVKDEIVPPVDTSINFTASSTASGYGFESQPLEVKIRAEIEEPDITVTPLTFNFGEVMVGDISTKIVTIKNDGNVDLSITDILITGTNKDNFSQTNDCPGKLSPDSSCTVEVTFSPTSEGDKTATLKITSDDPDEGEVDVALTGKGIFPEEGFQDITPEPSIINAVPGEEFTFSIKYHASSNALTGIGFYIHYNSFFLDFVEVCNIFEGGYMGLIAPEDDVDDRDQDPTTDKRFLVNWKDFSCSPSWPGEDLPLGLMDIRFHVKGWICPPLDTSINFTPKHTSQGCAFLSTSMKLHIVPFHLDVDGDGRVKPLTDGLLIIRYLFGLSGNNLVKGAIGEGANRTDSGKISDWIEKGENSILISDDIGSFLLDIDDDGVVMPLTDGLLVIRYLFCFRDQDLVMGVTDPDGRRTEPSEIVEYIERYLMPSP